MSLILMQSIESAVQLHRLPKSVIDIYVMVLQADGGELGAAITCASMAIANAGIEMYDLVSGCTVCSNNNEAIEDTILDPSRKEIDNSLGCMTVAIMPSTNEVTQWCHTRSLYREGVSQSWPSSY